jgi:hypothetical protein
MAEHHGLVRTQAPKSILGDTQAQTDFAKAKIRRF